MNYAHLICRSVRDVIAPRSILRARPRVLVSMPTRCGCGALVRLIGENRADGAWTCPLCGARYPYIFWKVRSESGCPKTVTEGDLILGLAEDACTTCGEGNPPCRCDRSKGK